MAITMASTLYIFNRTRKFTSGLIRMAIMVAKISGTTMPLAIYITATKAIKAIKIMLIFTVFGYL
jgi:hypothetical protein